MRAINIAIFVLSLLAAFQTLRLFARDRSSIRVTVLWLAIWLLIGVFGLFPQLIDQLLVLAMMGKRKSFFFLVSILILYALGFHQSVQGDQLRLDLKRMAQEISVLRHQLEQAKLPAPDAAAGNDTEA